MEQSGPRKTGRNRGGRGGLGCGRGHQAVLPGEPGVREKLEEQEGFVSLKNPGSKFQCSIEMDLPSVSVSRGFWMVSLGEDFGITFE